MADELTAEQRILLERLRPVMDLQFGTGRYYRRDDDLRSETGQRPKRSFSDWLFGGEGEGLEPSEVEETFRERAAKAGLRGYTQTGAGDVLEESLGIPTGGQRVPVLDEEGEDTGKTRYKDEIEFMMERLRGMGLYK